MTTLRNAIQQYGGIVESLVHAFLSFAPVAAGPEDIESERNFQLIQSISDLLALRHDKYLKCGATTTDALKFLLRVLKCFQLWGEMKSSHPHQFALRLEMVRVSLSMLILRNSSERLTELPSEETVESPQDCYVGARTGTRLTSFSKLFDPERPSHTQFSDFLHVIVPLVYLSSSRGWKKAQWTSWILAIALESASIMSLPDNCKQEKKIRVKRLFAEAIVRQPMFDLLLKKPGQAVSSIWNRIPLLRDINYLEYYLGMHMRYFYFHQ